jgi:hypothetical protein
MIKPNRWYHFALIVGALLATMVLCAGSNFSPWAIALSFLMLGGLSLIVDIDQDERAKRRRMIGGIMALVIGFGFLCLTILYIMGDPPQ